MKIVINTCYGGFGLSEDAMRRYAELKGLKCYVEAEAGSFKRYYTVPPEERRPKPDWRSLTDEQRREENEYWNSITLYDGNIERADPILVQVVEELGSEKASGECAELMIEEIAEGTRYRIDEYDGRESIETSGTIDWRIA